MGFFLKTLGDVSFDGHALSGTSRVVLLAYLCTETERSIKKIGEELYPHSMNAEKLLQEHLANLKKDLAAVGIGLSFSVKNKIISMETVATDYAQLITFCHKRNFDKIRSFAPGKFLDGFGTSTSVNKSMRIWIEKKENDRVSAIWDAYLESSEVPSLDSLEEAHQLAGAVPNPNSQLFVMLYDLLNHYARLDGSLAGKMLLAVRNANENSTALAEFVENTRADLDLEPRIFPRSHDASIEQNTQLEINNTDSEKQQSDADRKELSQGSKMFSKHKYFPFVVTGVIILSVLWLTLWPLSSYLNRRGANFLEAQDFSEALSTLRAAQNFNRLGPRRAVIPYNLANVLESLGRYDEASNFYQQAINLDSDLYAAYNNLSRLLLLQEKPEESLRFLARAYEQLENQPELSAQQAFILKNLAWTRYELGSFDIAQRDIDQALSLEPTMAASHCLAALIAEAKQERGLEHWENCVAYDTDDESVEPIWRSAAQERLASR